MLKVHPDTKVKICRYVDVGYLNGKIDNISDISDTSTIYVLHHNETFEAGTMNQIWDIITLSVNTFYNFLLS